MPQQYFTNEYFISMPGVILSQIRQMIDAKMHTPKRQRFAHDESKQGRYKNVIVILIMVIHNSRTAITDSSAILFHYIAVQIYATHKSISIYNQESCVVI